MAVRQIDLLNPTSLEICLYSAGGWGVHAGGPPRKRMVENRCVSQSYLQGRARTFRSKGALEGVVTLKESPVLARGV